MTAIGIFLVALFMGFIIINKYTENLEVKIDEDWLNIVKVLEDKLDKLDIIKDYIDKNISLDLIEKNKINYDIKRLRFSTSIDLKFRYYINLNHNIFDIIEKYNSYPQFLDNHVFDEMIKAYKTIDFFSEIDVYNRDVNKYNKFITDSSIGKIIKAFKYKTKDEIDKTMFYE